MRWSSFVVVTCLAVSCGSPTKPPSKIVALGAALPQTGDSGDQNYANSVQLAADTFNAALVAAKYKDLAIKLVIGDTQSLETTAVERATDLVKNQNVKGLVMESSRTTQAIVKLDYDADTTNDLSVPEICGSCTSEDINNPAYVSATDPVLQEQNRNTKGWLFKGQMSTKLQAKVLSQLILAKGDQNGDSVLKVSGLAQNDAFGTATLATLETYLKAANAANIVERLYFDRTKAATTIDWPAAIAQVTDNQTQNMDSKKCMATNGLCELTGTATMDGLADFHVMIGSAGFSAAETGARITANVTLPTYFVQGTRAQSTIDALGESRASLAKMEGTSHALLEAGPAGEVLKSDYEKAYGPVTFRVSTYYDCLIVLSLATAIAVKDLADPSAVTPEQIKAAMSKTSDPAGEVILTGKDEFVKALNAIAAGKAINYQGASGPMDFDAAQTVKNKLAHWKYENAAFVDLATYDCVTSDDCTKL